MHRRKIYRSIEARKAPGNMGVKYTPEQHDWALAQVVKIPDITPCELVRMFFRQFGLTITDSTIKRWMKGDKS